MHFVQALLVPERVHGLPEPVVAVRQQLILGEEPLEGVHHEVLAVPQVVEDLRAKNEEAAVDAQAGLPDSLDARHLPVVVRHDKVIAELRPDAEVARDPVAPPEMLQLRRERQVGEAVAVVREELLLTGEMWLDGLEALPDVRADPRVDEGDSPIADIALQELEPPPALAQHEVIRDAFVIVPEVALDEVGAVAEAEDEVLVAEVSVVFHHVPEDRAIPNRHHRLRDVLVVVPQAHPQTTAEQHDLHSSPPVLARRSQRVAGARGVRAGRFGNSFVRTVFHFVAGLQPQAPEQLLRRKRNSPYGARDSLREAAPSKANVRSYCSCNARCMAGSRRPTASVNSKAQTSTARKRSRSVSSVKPPRSMPYSPCPTRLM